MRTLHGFMPRSCSKRNANDQSFKIAGFRDSRGGQLAQPKGITPSNAHWLSSGRSEELVEEADRQRVLRFRCAGARWRRVVWIRTAAEHVLVGVVVPVLAPREQALPDVVLERRRGREQRHAAERARAHTLRVLEPFLAQ